MIKVNTKWNCKGKYRIEELKTVIHKAVDNDDDVITQFVEADYLKERIIENKTFESICKTLNEFHIIDL